MYPNCRASSFTSGRKPAPSSRQLNGASSRTGSGLAQVTSASRGNAGYHRSALGGPKQAKWQRSGCFITSSASGSFRKPSHSTIMGSVKSGVPDTSSARIINFRSSGTVSRNSQTLLCRVCRACWGSSSACSCECSLASVAEKHASRRNHCGTGR